MRIARIARTAIITTYVAEFNRDDFVVGLFVMMLYLVPGRRRLVTAELLHPLHSFARVRLFSLCPLDRLLFERESPPDSWTIVLSPSCRAPATSASSVARSMLGRVPSP